MSIRWLTVFQDLPSATFAVAEQFWVSMTAGRLSPRRGPDGEFVTVLPPAGDAYLRLQRVRAGAGGCHLDLHIDLATESLTEVAARATALGARVRNHEDGLIVLDSPGGLGFCLVPWGGERTVPDPVCFDSGGLNRLDQLCLDIPPDDFPVESRFWSALTGWAWHTHGRPEFGYLERPDGLPIRLLFQRRAVARPADRVTAHLDLACDDVPALAERQVGAGARVVAVFPHWTTLVDPAGQPYCLTARSPRTGRLR